ncbi:hypothetical protein BaRGS_00015023 [Batillaria attramentaria]|uniref:Transmembrane protein n=1 Tax=Batillaria attramentaria TaxID=370345 RepID=A0ABD0L2I3_9CAEN
MKRSSSASSQSTDENTRRMYSIRMPSERTQASTCMNLRPKNWAAALIGLSLFLAFLYVTGLMSYVPLLNRMVARKEPVIVTPLPPKIIHGHGRPPH